MVIFSTQLANREIGELRREGTVVRIAGEMFARAAKWFRGRGKCGRIANSFLSFYQANDITLSTVDDRVKLSLTCGIDNAPRIKRLASARDLFAPS